MHLFNIISPCLPASHNCEIFHVPSLSMKYKVCVHIHPCSCQRKIDSPSNSITDPQKGKNGSSVSEIYFLVDSVIPELNCNCIASEILWDNDFLSQK